MFEIVADSEGDRYLKSVQKSTDSILFRTLFSQVPCILNVTLTATDLLEYLQQVSAGSDVLGLANPTLFRLLGAY